MFHREIICVWLPNWPLQRLWADDALRARGNDRRELEDEHSRQDRRDAPVVIYRDAGQHGCRVVTCCHQAAECGVAHNMPLAEASALLPSEVDPHETSPSSEGNGDKIETSAAVAGPRFELADPQRDHAALVTLAHFCQQYTPLFGVDESESSESLFLDVTGCTHLFGGQQALVERIESDFLDAGYVVRVAMAKTFGAAWAIAHYFRLPTSACRGSDVTNIPTLSFVLEPALTEPTLNELPIAALRVAGETLRRFAEFDVLSIRQLRQLPRTSLPSRFGKDVLHRLDQALGERPEILSFEKPPEPVQEEWHSEYSTDNHAVLLNVLDDLLERICLRLSSRHEGTNELHICVNGPGSSTIQSYQVTADHSPSPPSQATSRVSQVFQFAVRLTEPTAQAKHLTDLIRLQLERESLKKQQAHTRRYRANKNIPQAFDAEFSQVIIRANSLALLARRPRDLFGGLLNQDNEKELQTLLDRLSNRLGSEAVVKATFVEDPQPELTFEWTPFVASAETRSANRPTDRPTTQAGEAQPADRPIMPSSNSRPLSLYPTPIPIEVQLGVESFDVLRFRCRQQIFQVTASEGPERIQTGWWRPEPIERDYFQVHTRDQQRFWLFRCGSTKLWFLHGVFD